MKPLLTFLLISPLHQLHGEERVYSQDMLKNWDELNTPIFEGFPEAKRIYEYYDVQRDLGIKIFMDKNADRALIIFWPSEAKPICHIDGALVEASEVFDTFSVNTYAVVSHLDIEGVHSLVEDRSEVVPYPIGAWFSKPPSGELQFLVSHDFGELSITWNDRDAMPWPILKLKAEK